MFWRLSSSYFPARRELRRTIASGLYASIILQRDVLSVPYCLVNVMNNFRFFKIAEKRKDRFFTYGMSPYRIPEIDCSSRKGPHVVIASYFASGGMNFYPAERFAPTKWQKSNVVVMLSMLCLAVDVQRLADVARKTIFNV